MFKLSTLFAILLLISTASARADCGALVEQAVNTSTEIEELTEGGYDLIALNLERSTEEANEEGLIYAQNVLETYNRYIIVLEQGIEEDCFGDWRSGSVVS